MVETKARWVWVSGCGWSVSQVRSRNPQAEVKVIRRPTTDDSDDQGEKKSRTSDDRRAYDGAGDGGRHGGGEELEAKKDEQMEGVFTARRNKLIRRRGVGRQILDLRSRFKKSRRNDHRSI